jgi:hypothetical protein
MRYEDAFVSTKLYSARDTRFVLGENNVHRGDKSFDRLDLKWVMVFLAIWYLVLHPTKYSVV